MSKMTRKIKRNWKKSKAKGSLLMEMASDFMDIIHNAKVYKKMSHKK